MSSLTSDGYVCLLNGSLRGNKASSFHFLNRVGKRLTRKGIATTRLAVEPGAAHVYPTATLAALHDAATVILACPLYGYCLPGGLMHLLEAWAHLASQHPSRRRARLYAIVNCGFVVPETITEAIHVIEHFCARLGLDFRFAIAIACGPVAIMTELVDLRLRRAYGSIATDIQLGSREPKPNLYIKPIVPRIFMDTVREHLDSNVQRDVRHAAERAR